MEFKHIKIMELIEQSQTGEPIIFDFTGVTEILHNQLSQVSDPEDPTTLLSYYNPERILPEDMNKALKEIKAKKRETTTYPMIYPSVKEAFDVEKVDYEEGREIIFHCGVEMKIQMQEVDLLAAPGKPVLYKLSCSQCGLVFKQRCDNSCMVGKFI